MKIALKLYASLSQLLPPEAARGNRMVVDVDPDETIAEIIEHYRVPQESAHLVMVNGLFIVPSERASRRLQENDELAIWPPVAGG